MILSVSSRRGLNSVYQGTTLQQQKHTGLIPHFNLLNSPEDTSQLSSILQLSIRLTIINNTSIYMGLNWGLIWFESGYGNSLAGWQQSYTWREFNLNPSREALRHQGGVETTVLKTRGCIVSHFTLTYTRKVALYYSRCVVIKLCASMLSDVGVLKLTDLVGSWGKRGLTHRFGLFSAYRSWIVLGRHVALNGFFSHRFGSNSYAIKMRTLFECQWFSWMLKGHSAAAIPDKVCSVK